MNVIWIMIDSLRYDFLGINGNPWIKTPNLDRFAAKSLVFEQAIALSLPTIPNRTDLFTGRYTFPRRPWGPLEDDDVTAAQRFGELGMYSQMFNDTPHLVAQGNGNFQRGFDGWQQTRGQEGDRFRAAMPEDMLRIHPTRPDVTMHESGGYVRAFSSMMTRRFETDYISPRTYTAAEQWLEYHYDKGPFFLYIDSFDPHEPWDPPAYYVEMYERDYGGQVIAFPKSYMFTDSIPEEQIRKVRHLYAGEVTMVDRWVGRLLQKIEDMGLLDTTMVAVMSDHGFLLGEHGRLGKSNRDGHRLYPATSDERYLHPWPYYREVSRQNLIIHMPWMNEGRRTPAIVQPVDLLPTTLEWLGADIPEEIEGRSIMPVLKGETDRAREFAITSFSLFPDDNNKQASAVTDGRWQLHFSGREGETKLFDIANDPKETRDLIEEHQEIARSLHERFMDTVSDKVNDPKKLERVASLPV